MDPIRENRRTARLDNGRSFVWYDWRAVFQETADADRLPYCLRVLLENCIRTQKPGWASPADVARLAEWRPGGESFAVPVAVSRVIMPDSSGLPALMDIAALRDALSRSGFDPGAVQPQIPADLVIDHSLIVDDYGHRGAIDLNVRREYERNGERYRFFKWAQGALENFRVVPPGMGIVHQVHLERLAQVIQTREEHGEVVAFPEFVLGGDSHTPMVNGLGVLAWGVGGVEIEAALLGEPYVTIVPRVVGVRLEGRLSVGTTVTDLVLTITEQLRDVGVTGAFVEFFGPSYATLTVPDRATIANMAPEYGATAAYFPIDENSIDYLRQTGREESHVALVEGYARQSGLFRSEIDPHFDEVVHVNLSEVVPSLSGPKRPQDRVALPDAGASFRAALSCSEREGGYGLAEVDLAAETVFELGGVEHTFGNGSLAIAAITACTSTSNPSVMLTAGLLAKAAVERGLKVPAYVKTSLAPGSLVVSHYLSSLGLLPFLEELGFFIVGYGCTTCSGKSGALVPEVSRAIEDMDLVAAAVVSSNRNFEGRLHRQVRAGYLASPPLVVAFALAGRVDIDLTKEPLGQDGEGKSVYLADIWPDANTVAAMLAETRRPEIYRRVYTKLFEGGAQWHALSAPAGVCFPWDEDSTYILPPPFFEDGRIIDSRELGEVIEGARVLGLFGDSLTTDHISPAGEIPVSGVAGRYLAEHGIAPSAFNAFTMRRGNHHVMSMGTYANVRIQNHMVLGQSGGLALKLPEGEVQTIYDAARLYREEGVPLIVIGGRDYGMGSSRDWAAKGPELLGVRAVLAVSFERIHRSNLIALGIVPLTFPVGENAESLGLDGSETFRFEGLASAIRRQGAVQVAAIRSEGTTTRFEATPALLSEVERQTLLGGGIFKRVYDRFRTRPHETISSRKAELHP